MINTGITIFRSTDAHRTALLITIDNNVHVPANKLNLGWKSYYLACYSHGVTELCFSSAEFSKHFCYTSRLNATCKSTEIQWSLHVNSENLIVSLPALEGFDAISDN